MINRYELDSLDLPINYRLTHFLSYTQNVIDSTLAVLAKR